jgi:redox-sensitive bicupin YhaK (pirin superfamily)
VSGPVNTVDAPDTPDRGHPAEPTVEVSNDREAMVGAIAVRRALPRRERRTVGAWCFADHMGRTDVTENAGLDIGPHPHIGLQTVTWLVEGEVLHRDSLGSEQLIRPGQLNLMTAGRGVAHSEEATGTYRGGLEGIQFWVALPDDTRDGAPAFEHHADLPKVDLGAGTATVLIGALDGATSPARHDTPLVGAELDLTDGTVTLPLDRRFEYALIVLRGSVALGSSPLEPGKSGYLGLDREELAVEAREPSRVMLIGGVPFAERISMWWNYVARTHDEIDAANRSWEADDGRFGRVTSALQRIPAPAVPWAPG